MQIGCAAADITPEIGLPLSGFIARENVPSTEVADPLYVRVLAADGGDGPHLLVVYDLLGIGRELETAVLDALARDGGPAFRRENCVLAATHNHSAPTVTPLEGEAEPDAGYRRLLCSQTVVAAREALGKLADAQLSSASRHLPGLTYNRRAVLADGRVSMALQPDAEVLRRGPVDDRLTLLQWRERGTGRPLAAVVHLACHGVALCTRAVSGDIPGELSRRVEQQSGVPCLFLQGASGDVNPTCVTTDHPTMLAWCDALFERLAGIEDELIPCAQGPFSTASVQVPIAYRSLPHREEVEARIRQLERIATGDVDSAEVQLAVRTLGNIMNIRPGERPDPSRCSFAAKALAAAETRVLEAVRSGPEVAPCPLRVSRWRMEDLQMVFAAAELFATTGLAVHAMGRGRLTLPVTHASPIVGYIPDAQSMRDGGYETDDAWRFYRQPAPFAPDAEERVLEAIRALLEE